MIIKVITETDAHGNTSARQYCFSDEGKCFMDASGETYAYIPADDASSFAEVGIVEQDEQEQEQALTRYANTLTGANDPDLISAAETLIEQTIKEEH